MHSSKLHKMVGIAVLAAIGFVLMNFAIPIIPAFPFLTLDLSDLVILLAVLLYGVSGGVEVALIRTLLHFVITGASVVTLIGDTAAFLASVAFMLPLALLVKDNYNWRRALTGIVFGTIALTLVMSLLNYFVLMPMYVTALGFKLNVSLGAYVLTGVVPFNLIKGVIVGAVFLVVARMLNWWLARNRQQLTH